ncbi:DUF2442 domain-containing protein [Clostridium transplantifaecale]|uniref:DUF2442 domain-containing protein n=1 Tax=Clostridium transplantifaecale TaxID=2479838 RepID=UPI000F638BAC|nr:DUF2442 domain-containing protein [Clostridium transplantifaecale]
MAYKLQINKENTPPIQSVTPLAAHRLMLRFATGSEVLLNMGNHLETLRYSPLADEDVFRSVTTNGNTLFFGVREIPPVLKPNFPEYATIAAVKIPVLEVMRLAVGFPVWGEE